MCFHTMNDSSIQGLDIRSEIWLEVDELDIGRLVGDQMAWKVVKCQSNMPVLAPELLIKLFDPLFKEFGGHPSCFVVAVSKTIVSWLSSPKASWLLPLSNIKNRPLLSAVLVTNECDSNTEAV